MEVHIHSRGITVRDNLKAHAEEKIGRLSKVFPDITSADVAFTSRSKRHGEDKYKVEITLHLHGNMVRAEEDTTSPFAAVDIVTEKLERQLKRFKGKLYRNLSREAKRGGNGHGRVADFLPEEIPEGMAGVETAEPPRNGHSTLIEPPIVDSEEELEDAYEEGLPVIVRSKAFAMKPMSAPEAALQMELIGHDFYVFYNPTGKAVNVVYRRKDGNYGLIEPV